MKKIFLVLTLVLLAFTGVTALTFTQEHLDINANQVGVTQVDITMSKFFFKDYVPLRSTFESLGFTVNWNDDMHMVEIVRANESIYIKPNEPYFLINGVLTKADQKPRISSMRMQLPASTLNLIFETVTPIDNNQLRLSNTLVKNNINLPTLKDLDEYNKLLSFYPEQVLYLFKDGVDLNFGVMEDEMVEETSMEMPAGSSVDFSETNNQVDGVDESDIVKQDKDYIYALRDNSLQIIKTGRNQLEVKHNLSENGFFPNQLFIREDKLILIGPEHSTKVKTYEENNRIVTLPVYKNDALMVKVYDKSDLDNKAPTLIKSFGVEGHLIAARLVEDYVYIVANQHHAYSESFMPQVLEGGVDDTLNAVDITFENVAYLPGHVSHNILYTMGIDLNNLSLDGLDVDTYIGGGSTIYADRDSLYIAMHANSSMWWGNWEDRTDIFSFDLDSGSIDFKAKGSVPGTILNQFSMDEYDKHFRITTTSWGTSNKTGEHTSLNNLFILDDSLKQVGSVEELAPGERIYSTRMMGDKVYMVTYRQVDPFYVIDTFNPREPQVLGYLKIPGYSSYLHPYDEKTIIGIGMETIDKGDRVVNDGVKISLFDVSDFNNPIEKDKVILGNGGSSTDVSYDHKAFLFNKEKNILAIPARISSGDYTDESQNAFIFSFTKQGMLDFRGRISHVNADSNNKHYYDHSKGITRILYNGNDLYTLSNNHLQLNDFDTLNFIDQLNRN